MSNQGQRTDGDSVDSDASLVEQEVPGERSSAARTVEDRAGARGMQQDARHPPINKGDLDSETNDLCGGFIRRYLGDVLGEGATTPASADERLLAFGLCRK